MRWPHRRAWGPRTTDEPIGLMTMTDAAACQLSTEYILTSQGLPLPLRWVHAPAALAVHSALRSSCSRRMTACIYKVNPPAGAWGVLDARPTLGQRCAVRHRRQTPHPLVARARSRPVGAVSCEVAWADVAVRWCGRMWVRNTPHHCIFERFYCIALSRRVPSRLPIVAASSH